MNEQYSSLATLHLGTEMVVVAVAGGVAVVIVFAI